MQQLNRRTLLAKGLTIAAVLNAGCSGKTTMMSFVVFNYWSQPIADVFVDGEWAGLAPERSPSGTPGDGGTIGPISLKPGKKIVKWTLNGAPKTPRVLEVITASFDLKNIEPDHRYATIHVYPDETVFIETSKSIPDARPKK